MKKTPFKMEKVRRIAWKTLKITLIVLAVLLAFILCGGLGPLVKWTAPVVAKCMGADVSLEECVILPLGGYVRIGGLRVENPETFRVGNAQVYDETPLAQVGNLEVNVAMTSLFKDTYVVEKIELTGLRALYAFDYDTTNVDALVAQMDLAPAEGEVAPEETPPEAEAEAEAQPPAKAKDVHLAYVNLADNMVTVRKFVNIPVTLPPVTLEDVNSRDLIQQLKASLEPVMKAIQGLGTGLGAALDGLGSGLNTTGDTLGDGLDVTTETLKESVHAVGDGAKESIKNIRNLFKKK